MSFWHKLNPLWRGARKLRDQLGIEDVLDIVRALSPADKLRVYDLIRTEISTLDDTQYAWGMEPNKAGEESNGKQPHN